MNIVSTPFAVFLVPVLFLYYLLPHREQNCLLLIASCIFYALFSWWFLAILVVFTAFNFFASRKIQNGKRAKASWLWTGVAFNLLTLVLFKYANFFKPEITGVLKSMGIQTDGLGILLPVGLSFYVLQAISYLVDVSRGQAKATSKWVDFALYMSYFPKLTAGPIERARSFLPLLDRQRVVDNETLARSFTLIVIGLVRKTVIADPLMRAIPDKVFEMPSQFSGVELCAWLIAFSFALYNDFAGYTKIVRGISGLFGIELSRNFANPLFARNFTELWNRWHITLSSWLRDYVYFPLSRSLVRRNPSRYNIANLILPPVVTMMVSGFWHGTGWNMLAWGLLMGLCQVVERIPSLWRPVVSPEKRPIWRQVLAMATLWIVSLMTLPPFLMDLPAALDFWKGLIQWNDLALPNSRVFLVIIPAILIDWVQYRSKDELVFMKCPLPVRSTLLALAILAVFLSTRQQIGEPFIYQGF